MPRLTPVNWRTLVKVFEAEGFVQERSQGSHLILVKPGVERPVVIPRYAEVRVTIILANLKTAGIRRERYFELLGRIG